MKKHLPLVFGRPQLKTCCLGYHFFVKSDQSPSARIQADSSEGRAMGMQKNPSILE